MSNGKPQGVFNQPGGWHTFIVDGAGVMWEAYGEPADTLKVLADGFEPHADVTVQNLRLPPDNNFGTYYGVSAAKEGGGVRSMYWVGTNWQKADHWEGPIDAVNPGFVA